ncbi:hypothetical protein CI109_101086 [Kwoniella shandongensis]|uniref:Uncharacterized protein n=1 Tax=Kwoniella shandongensis TaxID=1734106 RepID=A0A5M6CAN8_9TREE|nr:uncharacterized protein CI109_001555 [Kwoniella shandongensis]KAA5530149.1 hypothetical protein CI109_001555 [Kwoniella shandongensis]
MATPAGKYVPPSRRPGYIPPSSSSLPPPGPSPQRTFRHHNQPTDLYSPTDLFHIFNHSRQSTFTYFSFPVTLTRPPRPPPMEYDPCRRPETTPLPPSPPPPPPQHPLSHLVSYVTIVPNGHPAWDSEMELWSHTNAEMLIEDWQGDKKNFERPLPVFKGWKGRQYEYEFHGWCTIDSIEIVPPHSDELKRMLAIKERSRAYGRGGRTAEAWNESFNTTWLKIHFSKAQGEYKEPSTLEKGKGDRYLLEIGGLKEELEVLDSLGEARENEQV